MRILFPFILAALFLGLSAIAKAPSGVRENAKPAQGVIDRVIYLDGGNVRYYVNLTIDGQPVQASSVTYSSKTKTLNEGESVQVLYYYTKAGDPRVMIQDSRIVSCGETTGGKMNIFKILAIILIVYGIFQIVTLFA